jgi:Protein of unknown function (DUF2950)
MITLLSFINAHRSPALARVALLTAAILVVAMASVASAQQSFKTAEEAAEALVNAAKSGDRKAILTVLGPDGADIVSSGDPVADKATREEFVAAYDAKHQVTIEGDDKAILIVGNEDFPLPIPLVRKDGAWRFDTAAGREEILYRRIGRNELNAIQAALAYVDAQQEYAEKGVAGPGVYARRLVSRPGRKDGLYWPAKDGEDESPLGELAAAAAAKGYRADQERRPYHGYSYKILTRQGDRAPGGALDYVVNGKMIGGFALVAYPAEYGNSGVMTFLVNHQGVVYQKDLGPNTARIAEGMRNFNPDTTWQRVDDKGQPQNGAQGTKH